MNFSKNLKEQREKNNLTQEKLATELNKKQVKITKYTIRDYEQNKTQPKFEILEKLCEILNCSYDDLLK